MYRATEQTVNELSMMAPKEICDDVVPDSAATSAVAPCPVLRSSASPGPSNPARIEGCAEKAWTVIRDVACKDRRLKIGIDGIVGTVAGSRPVKGRTAIHTAPAGPICAALHGELRHVLLGRSVRALLGSHAVDVRDAPGIDGHPVPCSYLAPRLADKRYLAKHASKLMPTSIKSWRHSPGRMWSPGVLMTWLLAVGTAPLRTVGEQQGHGLPNALLEPSVVDARSSIRDGDSPNHVPGLTNLSAPLPSPQSPQASPLSRVSSAYPAGIKAWYCCGAYNIAGGTWPDQSGNGNTATLSGNPDECARTYSSVWNGEACGVGHAQSMLYSPGRGLPGW